MVADRTLDTNGWPERYFAVIFTAQRSLSGDDIYDMTADRMVFLAQRQPGFLGLESVRGDDGIGITVSYWVDRAAIAKWRSQAWKLDVVAVFLLTINLLTSPFRLWFYWPLLGFAFFLLLRWPSGADPRRIWPSRQE